MKPLLYSSLLLYFGYNLYTLGKNIKKTDAVVFNNTGELKNKLSPDSFLFKPFIYIFAESQFQTRKVIDVIKSKIFKS